MPNISLTAAAEVWSNTSQDEFIEAVNGVIEADVPSGGTDWEKHLNDEFYTAVDGEVGGSGRELWNHTNTVTWKWSGDNATTPCTAASGSVQPANATDIPYYDTDTNTWYVWSGEQLRYALIQSSPTYAAGGIGGNIEIMADIDLNGNSGKNWETMNFNNADSAHPLQVSIKGNNHTVYNLMSLDVGTSGQYAGLIGLVERLVDFSMTNLDFDHMNLCSVRRTGSSGSYTYAKPNGNGSVPHAVGIVGWNAAYRINYDNVNVKHSMLTGGSYVGALYGRYDRKQNAQSFDNQYHSITNCSADDVVAAGDYHVGALGGALVYLDEFGYNYAVNSTVISAGGHSGGLIACMGDVYKAHDCYADVQVYGTIQTGGFTGSANCIRNASGVIIGSYVNCFTSGFVEGREQMGGFLGLSPSCCLFINCYSTALVGLTTYAGTSFSKIGGFIGDVSTGYTYCGMVNCYAAGEVGAANTDVTPEAATTNYIGGFAGYCKGVNYRDLYAHCYYDKQTTAMREWSNGAAQNILETTVAENTYAGQFAYLKGSTNFYASLGLNGVLTTDTTKSGTGLTSAVGATGFQGFLTIDDFSDGAKSTYFVGEDISWSYDAINHNPELNVFANAVASDWGGSEEKAKLAREYSKSSTATVQLETWDKDFDSSTGKLNQQSTLTTTYDTVRDLTIHFNCTGDKNQYSWYRIGTQSGDIGATANANGKKVHLLGHTTDDDLKDVLILANKSSTTGNTTETVYYADKFSPGQEWLDVTFGNASRRLRVMPTVGINAGEGKTVYAPNSSSSNKAKKDAFYDHADDVELYYSQASQIDSIVTGIYPDAKTTSPNDHTEADSSGVINNYNSDYTLRANNPLTSRQQELMDDTGDTETSSYFLAAGHGENLYGMTEIAADKKSATYPGYGSAGCVDASFMARNSGTSVTSALNSNSANGSTLRVYANEIKTIDNATGSMDVSDEMLDFTDTLLADALNGNALLYNRDGIYLLRYVWQLADGRIVEDAKLITLKSTPFSADLTMFDSGALANSTDGFGNPDYEDSTTTGDKILDGKVDLTKLLGNASDEAILNAFNGDASGVQYVTGATETLGLPQKNTKENLYSGYEDPITEQAYTPDEIGPEIYDTLVAAWQVTNQNKYAIRLTVRMDSGLVDANDQRVWFTASVDPSKQTRITVPYYYYRYVISDEGVYYVQVEQAIDTDGNPQGRVYDIKSTTINGNTVYYMAFNKNETAPSSYGDKQLNIMDVSNNINIEVELSPNDSLTVKNNIDSTNVNAGLLTSTIKAANNYAFNYSFNNAGGEASGETHVAYPNSSDFLRNDSSITGGTLTYLNKASEETPTYNRFAGSSASTMIPVTNANYLWTDYLSDNNSGVGKIGSVNGFNMLYNESAQFFNQIDRNSDTQLIQTNTLKNVNRNGGINEVSFNDNDNDTSYFFDTQWKLYNNRTPETPLANGVQSDNGNTYVGTDSHQYFSNSADGVNETNYDFSLTVEFKNIIKTQSITITKRISDDSDPDANAQFKFTVAFDSILGDKSSNTYTEYPDLTYTISGVTGNQVYNDGIVLTDGQTATITGVPLGTKYKVVEEGQVGTSTLNYLVKSATSSHSDSDCNFSKSSVIGSFATEDTAENIEFVNTNKLQTFKYIYNPRKLETGVPTSIDDETTKVIEKSIPIADSDPETIEVVKQYAPDLDNIVASYILPDANIDLENREATFTYELKEYSVNYTINGTTNTVSKLFNHLVLDDDIDCPEEIDGHQFMYWAIKLYTDPVTKQPVWTPISSQPNYVYRVTNDISLLAVFEGDNDPITGVPASSCGIGCTANESVYDTYTTEADVDRVRVNIIFGTYGNNDVDESITQVGYVLIRQKNSFCTKYTAADVKTALENDTVTTALPSDDGIQSTKTSYTVINHLTPAGGVHPGEVTLTNKNRANFVLDMLNNATNATKYYTIYTFMIRDNQYYVSALPTYTNIHDIYYKV